MHVDGRQLRALRIVDDEVLLWGSNVRDVVWHEALVGTGGAGADRVMVHRHDSAALVAKKKEVFPRKMRYYRPLFTLFFVGPFSWKGRLP